MIDSKRQAHLNDVYSLGASLEHDRRMKLAKDKKLFEERLAKGLIKPFAYYKEPARPISKSWLGRKRRAAQNV
ncbi:hypothetical protein [Enterobacter sp. BIDMC92]|uniref:hypothetical protein n=1 Tax=Enterobacter sp. BIDMC92 TaxID=1594172 RepID=UPI00064D0BB7|nr:hypothetical protein [Enterobacter sp. BIDMC92]